MGCRFHRYTRRQVLTWILLPCCSFCRAMALTYVDCRETLIGGQQQLCGFAMQHSSSSCVLHAPHALHLHVATCISTRHGKQVVRQSHSAGLFGWGHRCWAAWRTQRSCSLATPWCGSCSTGCRACSAGSCAPSRAIAGAPNDTTSASASSSHSSCFLPGCHRASAGVFCAFVRPATLLVSCEPWDPAWVCSHSVTMPRFSRIQGLSSRRAADSGTLAPSKPYLSPKDYDYILWGLAAITDTGDDLLSFDKVQAWLVC